MNLDLDDLFDEADALATEDTPLPPDLPLPSNYDVATPQRLMEVRNDTINSSTSGSGDCNNGTLGASSGNINGNGKGRGWYARAPIEAGTVLLVEKPMAMIMRWEEDEAEDDAVSDDGDMSLEDDDHAAAADANVKLSAAAKAQDANYQDEHDDDEKDDDDNPPPAAATTGGSVGTALLVMRLAEIIQLDPKLWTEGISQLYPQNESMARNLPPWVCSDNARIGLEMERCLMGLSEVPELNRPATVSGSSTEGSNSTEKGMTIAEQIRLRLPLVVRYNSLSVETSPELFVHPGPTGHVALSGTALFVIASLFNHSSRPNVSRWAVGDVTFFVANRSIEAGTELCISYVEHEILCEDDGRRTAVLGMDFVDTTTDDCNSSNDENVNVDTMVEDDGKRRFDTDSEAEDDKYSDDDEVPTMPVVDAEVQQELMDMPPDERLGAIDELLAQAEGRRAPDDHAMDDGDDEGEDDGEGGGEGTPWFQCDAHQLRILQALTLDGMGQHGDALPIWEGCVDFVDKNLPPMDESGIALRVQAALCAWAMGREKVAHSYARRAMADHDKLFGGGAARFRRRYRREVELNIRPDVKKRPIRGIKVMRKLFPVAE
mmetsp:Transcript_13087/g.27685  ORF Transcript_13087/g.27685 Transcript_13087/m.27685 type:complete len:603 (+) Transcript_13087:159-1967(+)